MFKVENDDDDRMRIKQTYPHILECKLTLKI